LPGAARQTRTRSRRAQGLARSLAHSALGDQAFQQDALLRSKAAQGRGLASGARGLLAGGRGLARMAASNGPCALPRSVAQPGKPRPPLRLILAYSGAKPVAGRRRRGEISPAGHPRAQPCPLLPAFEI